MSRLKSQMMHVASWNFTQYILKLIGFFFSFLGVAAIDRELDDYRVRSILSMGLFGAEQSFMN